MKVTRSMKTIGMVVLGAAVLAGCSAKPSANPAGVNASEQQIKTVKVTKVTKQKIGEPVEQVADVVSSLQIDVTLKVGGDVQQVLKKRGDTVSKGETILKLDPTDTLLQKEKSALGIKSAQAQLTKAKEDLENGITEMKNSIIKAEEALKEAQKNYNKLRNDYDLGLVSKNQLDQAETQVNNLQLDVDMLKQKLHTMETTNSLAPLEVQLQSSNLALKEVERALENHNVKAPISGILTDLTAEAGMTLPGGFKVGQIVQMNPIKIKADLTESAAKLVEGKKELTFYVPGSSEKMKGKITYLAKVMSPQSKSYPLELEVPNADMKLRPGMKVQVQLTNEAEQVVVAIPTTSIVREGSETYVFVLAGDHAERRKVELGRLNGSVQEVISGVKENDQLIISGQHQLKDKEKVQLAK